MNIFVTDYQTAIKSALARYPDLTTDGLDPKGDPFSPEEERHYYTACQTLALLTPTKSAAYGRGSSSFSISDAVDHIYDNEYYRYQYITPGMVILAAHSLGIPMKRLGYDMMLGVRTKEADALKYVAKNKSTTFAPDFQTCRRISHRIMPDLETLLREPEISQCLYALANDPMKQFAAQLISSLAVVPQTPALKCLSWFKSMPFIPDANGHEAILKPHPELPASFEKVGIKPPTIKSAASITITVVFATPHDRMKAKMAFPDLVEILP